MLNLCDIKFLVDCWCLSIFFSAEMTQLPAWITPSALAGECSHTFQAVRPHLVPQASDARNGRCFVFLFFLI